MTVFAHRLAMNTDIPAIADLMDKAIRELQRAFLTPDQIAASHEVMGLDTQLIEDQSYFVIEADNTIVGCGGWSMRTTLFGSNHTTGRDSAFLNPATDPARIRAMYTHPDWARQGIGALLIKLCEQSARDRGFKEASLAATLAGEPLYKKYGYKAIEYFTVTGQNGAKIPLIRMHKVIT